MEDRPYAGDVTPEEVWETLEKEPRARVVDVRTAAEWTFVGLPDLSARGGNVLRVEWQSFPAMQMNPDFVRSTEAALSASGADRESPVFFLCRSGARSASAAAVMTKAGYGRCFNIAGGFEGAKDPEGHRGTIEGWKAMGLPWSQN